MSKPKRDWVGVFIEVVSLLCMAVALWVLSNTLQDELQKITYGCVALRDPDIVGVQLELLSDIRDNCGHMTASLKIFEGLMWIVSILFGVGVFKFVKGVVFWRDPEAQSKP